MQAEFFKMKRIMQALDMRAGYSRSKRKLNLYKPHR